MCKSLSFIQWLYKINYNVLNKARMKGKQIIPGTVDNSDALLATSSFILDVLKRDDNFLSEIDYSDIMKHLCCD